MAARDASSIGILINPEHRTASGAILFLNRENLLHIIQYAEEAMNGMPDTVRDALIKGI